MLREAGRTTQWLPIADLSEDIEEAIFDGVEPEGHMNEKSRRTRQ